MYHILVVDLQSYLIACVYITFLLYLLFCLKLYKWRSYLLALFTLGKKPRLAVPLFEPLLLMRIMRHQNLYTICTTASIKMFSLLTPKDRGVFEM